MITFKSVDTNPESADSRMLWEWRNDETTRKMSRTTDVIPWENHKAWYAKAATDPNKAIFIAFSEDQAACMIRFDFINQGDMEININMNPAMRGKGLGKPVLAAACAYGFKTLALNRIYAEIKPENTPSVKIFEGVGFKFLGKREDLNTYELKRGELR